MSAHRTLKDLYRAFIPNIGPGILQDPGDGGTIEPDMYGQTCEMTSATTETRILERPNRSGIPFVLRLYSDGGTVTLTVTGGMNPDGDTEATFADAGDFLSFISVKASATTYRWEILEGNVGTVVTSASVSSTPSESVSASVSNSPSDSVSASPSDSPSAT